MYDLIQLFTNLQRNISAYLDVSVYKIVVKGDTLHCPNFLFCAVQVPEPQEYNSIKIKRFVQVPLKHFAFQICFRASVGLHTYRIQRRSGAYKLKYDLMSTLL